MLKRNSLALRIVGAALVVLFALAAAVTFFTHNNTYASGQYDRDNRAMTINQLKNISVVGSTAFAIDGNGKTATVDANPYGVQVCSRPAIL